MAQTTFREYLQETEDAISSGRYDDALLSCQHILANFPESLEAQRLLGEVYLAQGHLEEAQQTFDWVLTNDPENIIAYCDRALISERRSDFDTALDCYQQAYELSRGNSQIRKEFNKLSVQAGQQGFMFSRAGLARLYMRGDLFLQAIQEWEAVLSVTPDRLDARTGLLEVYWREGLYDQVEHLATQILQDVPGCLKALLLQAYVAASKNMSRAQELLQRAEALDPDLVMAQDLFSDMIASQPDEPFLKLLKKGPASLEKVQQATAAPALLDGEKTLAFPRGTADLPTSTNGLSEWSSIGNWNNESAFARSQQDTLIQPQQELLPKQEGSDLPVWTNESIAKVWGDQRQGSQLSKEPDIAEQLTADMATLDAWGALGSKVWGDQQQDAKPEPMSDITVRPADRAKLDAWSMPGQNAQSAEREAPMLAPWEELQKSRDDAALKQDQTELEPWKQFQESYTDAAPAQDRTTFEPWEALQASRDDAPGKQDQQESEPWKQFAESSAALANIWGNKDNIDTAEPEDAWASPAKEEEGTPAPPAWLNMLTQGERRQLSGAMPALPAEQKAPARQPSSPLPEPTRSEPSARQDKLPEQATPEVSAGDDEDEEAFSFGPEWLKSLGAATLDADPEEELALETPPARSSQPLKSEPEPEPESQITPDPWGGQSSEPAWMAQLSRSDWKAPEPVSAWTQKEAELAWTLPKPQSDPEDREIEAAWTAPEPEKDDVQSVLTTLEDLEQELYSQGFVPLEPNSLSAIAQSQGASSSREAIEEPLREQESYQEPTLSSALAELGSFMPASPTNLPASSVAPAASAQAESEAVNDPVEPLWLASLRSAPASAPASHMPEVPPVQSSIPASPVFDPAQWSPEATVVGVPDKPPVRVESVPAFSPTPASPSTTRPLQEPPKTPVMRDALLDGELETTMKRPAVRLQPMQQRSAVGPNQGTGPLSERGRGGRAGGHVATSKAADGALSQQERLLRGYQCQLAGNYDEAMQEYRVIIRNAPQLLGEVVSNVRALLKLAPKYSAGYRVLGDAYMRQGEYLQAMEAYNKALTMAKKARVW
jgi:tetratricopeptide (TPR) repeat protein